MLLFIPFEIGIRPDTMLLYFILSLAIAIGAIVLGTIMIHRGKRGVSLSAFFLASVCILFQIVYFTGYHVNPPSESSSVQIEVSCSDYSNLTDAETIPLSAKDTEELLNALSRCRLRCSGFQFGQELLPMKQTASEYVRVRIGATGEQVELLMDCGVGSFIHNPRTFGTFDLVITDDAAIQDWWEAKKGK